jgi:hypothetical protein
MKEVKHALIAIAIQLIAGFAVGQWFVGGLIPSVFFVGREHAQAEYRWIEKYGQWRRYNLKWHHVFDKRIWNVHSFWWNLCAPICANVTIFLLATYLGA